MIPSFQTIEPESGHHKRRIVITALGSFGDLHPYIAIALGLKQRGHEVVFAASECYRQKIGALGINFQAVRPDSDWVYDPEAMQRYMNLYSGMVWLVKEKVLSVLRESYEDTMAVAKGADLLVSHPFMAYSTRLVSEKTGIPWVSAMVTPLGFFSTYDVPVVPLIPHLSRGLRCLGPAFWGPLFWINRRAYRFLAKPWYRLRADIGLPPTKEGNPLTDSNSPTLVLALFSKLIAAKQPDWPPHTVITGFPIYDRDGEIGLPPELSQFLDDGAPPIVFTLGMSASVVAGQFYEHSVAAAQRLGQRAVLITGKNPRNLPAALPVGIIACDYAPFSMLFPRAAAVVHHGGIGTTALAMRAERPMLVVPFAHDNPDIAARVTRLGIARTIPYARYSTDRLAAELRRLLSNPAYAQRAAVIGEQMQQEDGVQTACDALEELLQNIHAAKSAAGA